MFKRMLTTADVVVENFRPDVKDRLGIGYEALKAINPRIILASISGFGQTGPYKARAGFDQIAQGMGGLMWVTGLPGKPRCAPAPRSPIPAPASLPRSASLSRCESGIRPRPMGALFAAPVSDRDDGFSGRALPDRWQCAATGRQRSSYHSTPMGVVNTADGFINIGVGGEGHWKAFCKAIGKPELADGRISRATTVSATGPS